MFYSHSVSIYMTKRTMNKIKTRAVQGQRLRGSDGGGVQGGVGWGLRETSSPIPAVTCAFPVHWRIRLELALSDKGDGAECC